MIFSTLKRNICTFGLTAVFSFILASANAQTWSAQAIGGSATGDKCVATCMDGAGNVYVAGTISTGTSTFGTSTFASAGLFDGIVLKYNSSGVLQWGYRFGSTLNDNAMAIATDGTNVYVAGTYTASMTIGTSALTSAGSTDGVVMSLNASTGAANWGTSFGGSSAENVYGITVDASSNIYITGNFFSAPAAFGSFSLTPVGGSDMFVAKLNTSGVFQWANNGGGTGNDDPVGGSVSYVPALGELVVVGGVNGGGTLTYGGVSFAASTGGGNDIVLLEVNAGTGAFISGTSAGGNGSSNEDALASCYDAYTGNVMLSGYFNSPSFILGSTTLSNSTAAGAVDDMFYASYNPTTNTFAWAKAAGGAGAGSDRARGICSNGTGGIILGGLISGNSTCTFPSSSTVQIVNVRTNGGDPFLAQVDAATGNAVWAKVGAADAATTTDNAINAVTCSSGGTIWGAGQATNNLTFSPLTALTGSGGVDIFAVKLIAPPPLSATQSQVNLTCNGVCTGSATVVASGGTTPYTYSWSPSGGSGAIASSLCSTNYTVTITDAAATSITKTFSITQPPAISSSITSQTNVACFGGSNGAATISASGGTGTLTYNWTPGNPAGDGTVSVTGLTATTWTCTITDANSCSATRPVIITAPPVINTTSGSQTNVACFGGSNGAASVSPTGGTGAGSYSYDWAPGTPTGDGTNTVTGLPAGTYTVTVTDGNACTATRTYTITQPSATVSGTTVVTNVSCFGGSNGSINLTPTGGSGGYTYNWLPSGPTTEDRTGLTAGTYTVQITDLNGCTGTVPATVTQPTTPVSGTTVVTNVSCFGGSNGSINLTPTGGSGGYTYNWLPSGPTTEDRTGLTAGTYTVQITDLNGCTGTVPATVTQPTTPVSGTTVVTNVSCFGGSNGSINLTPSGGSGGYTYNWLPSGPTTEDRTGLTAGTYTVQITDLNGCTGTVPATVTQPTTPVSGTTVVTNVSCFGGSNGSINLTPSGGSGGYTYNWLPSGPTTEDRTGLTAGTYTVQITDLNGCTGTVPATVTQPTTPVSGTTVVTNVSCFGGSNGSINLTPTGGSGGYTYNWLPSGPTTEDRTGLTAGTYTVQITDLNGCTGTVPATVTQPTAPVSGTTVVTNVSCFGGSNGSINLTPSGGSGGYTYNWLPSGPTTEDRTGLTAGTYTVQITDLNGCTGTVPATVTQPTTPVSGTTVVTNVSCFGGSNGSINLTPSGGSGGYTYNWLPSGPTTEDRTGLTAGTYTVQITDLNGCTRTVPATVTQPTAPVSGTTVVTNVSCFGGSNGSINLTPSGGSGGYTYNWLPSGPTTEDRTGLTAGTYTVQITDLNGCTGTVNATTTQPTAINTSSGSQTNVSCNGGSNGAASITPSGGTPGYTYSWAPSGGTAATASGLTAGTYTVTVTDANGCTATSSYTITEPPVINTSSGSQTNVSCNGGSNGTASITPSGGTPGYTYAWAPSGGTAATASGLTAGTYTVTVTDANGCTATSSYTITEPPVMTATTSQTNAGCSGTSTGSASVIASGGAGGYTYSWSPSGGTDATASDLAAGDYTCTITDANGCSIIKDFIITESPAITATTSQTDVTCTGGATGTATVVASGGTGAKTYLWLPSGGTEATAINLAAGSYTCTITDENLCSITKTFTITEPVSIPGSNSYLLPTSNQIVSNTAGTFNFVEGTCELVSTVLASGTNPVSGMATSKVWIEGTVPTDNGYPFVQRHYEITPADNAADATGTVTLYFTQAEFDNFNAHAGSTLKLPVDADDNAGKANLRIGKYSGISGDGTGLPASYSGSTMVIDPNDNDIVWNAVSGAWEVTFAVDGFSGFIVQTNVLVLPVNWISFTIKKVNESVLLNWSTAAEHNTKDFSIQHSTDGRSWKTTGIVAAVGNSSSPHNYTYMDNNTVQGYNYYRVMQTDLDGKINYSEMRVIKMTENYAPFTVHGNPVSNGILQVQVHQATTLSLYAIDGKLLWMKQFTTGLQSIDVSRYAQGIYLLKASGKTQKIFVE